MSDLNREIVYVFRMQDNTSEVASNAAEASDKAGQAADTATVKEEKLNNAANKTTIL